MQFYLIQVEWACVFDSHQTALLIVMTLSVHKTGLQLPKRHNGSVTLVTNMPVPVKSGPFRTSMGKSAYIFISRYSLSVMCVFLFELITSLHETLVKALPGSWYVGRVTKQTIRSYRK